MTDSVDFGRGATSSATETGVRETHGFSFSGSGREYFGIWIVNLLLSIVTIGIYTAWAKVRRLRYFYGNTWLDGHNFEYHAKPIQILIGRIVVVVVLVIFNILASISPILSLILIVPYLVGIPWLINKALSFNARVTSYRNVHFNFEGSYGRAFWVFVALPFIIPIVFGVFMAAVVGSFQTGIAGVSQTNLIIVFGIAAVGALAYALFIPYISKQTNTYIAECTRFGSAKFEPNIMLKPLYQNMGLTLLIVIAPIVFIAVLGAVMLGGPAEVSSANVGFFPARGYCRSVPFLCGRRS